MKAIIVLAAILGISLCSRAEPGPRTTNVGGASHYQVLAVILDDTNDNGTTSTHTAIKLDAVTGRTWVYISAHSTTSKGSVSSEGWKELGEAKTLLNGAPVP